MTTDITEILDTIASIDGAIAIRNLAPDAIAALGDKVVFSFSDRREPNYVCLFGGDSFRAEGQLEQLNLGTGHPQFDYEIKAIFLLLWHVGIQEGGRPLKWTTIRSRISALRRFGLYCANRRLKSFRDLNSLPELKLRNLLNGFLNDDDDGSAGWLTSPDTTGNYAAARAALGWLKSYGFVSAVEFSNLLDNLTLPGIAEKSTNRRRHSIVPTGVLKTLVGQAVAYIDGAEARFDELATVFREANEGIAERRTKKWDAAIRKTRRAACARLAQLLSGYFDDLQLHTYMLVLAFTGMRDNEAGGLVSGCGGFKIEEGETLYYINSLLSKTDDYVIPLDWVANDLAYRATNLLSRVNELFYDRAELFLEHYGDHMPAEHRHGLEHGLKDRFLFGVRFSAGSATFINYTKSSGSASHLCLARYEVALSAQDVLQLEQLECNYRPTAYFAEKRGLPYLVGDVFKPTAHQFRHTFAWFVVANRLGDIDDIKYQFKHLRQAMTLIYAERGFQSLNELRAVVEDFESLVNGLSVTEIVEAAAANTIAGGGGERLAKMIQKLNADAADAAYGNEHQPQFKDMREVIAFATRHSESIRGLPHGYCSKGPTCKIKNAADPSHCLYCDTYFATPKHLPYWRVIRVNCETKLDRIANLSTETQAQYQAFKQSLEDNLFAANKIIARLSTPAAQAKGAS